MSGVVSVGAFKNSGEQGRLTMRGINDRAVVVADLRRLVERHGGESAAVLLGSWGSGGLFAVIEGSIAAQAPLLDAMYGPRGRKLKPDLMTAASPECPVLVVAAPKPEALYAAASMDTPRELVREAVSDGWEQPSPVMPVAAGPVAHGPKPRAVELSEAETMALIATIERAVAHYGKASEAARAMGIGHSSFGFLRSGVRPFTDASMALVRAWGMAHPDAGPAVDVSRAAEEVAALSALGLDRAGVVAMIKAAQARGATRGDIGAVLGCCANTVSNLLTGNRRFNAFLAAGLHGLAKLGVPEISDAPAVAVAASEPQGVAGSHQSPPPALDSGVATEDAAPDRGGAGISPSPSPVSDTVAAIDARAAEPPAVAGLELPVAMVEEAAADTPAPSSPQNLPSNGGADDRFAAWVTGVGRRWDAGELSPADPIAAALASLNADYADLVEQDAELEQARLRVQARLRRIQGARLALAGLTEVAA